MCPILVTSVRGMMTNVRVWQRVSMKWRRISKLDDDHCNFKLKYLQKIIICIAKTKVKVEYSFLPVCHVHIIDVSKSILKTLQIKWIKIWCFKIK